MVRGSVEQATCTECQENEDNYRVSNADLQSDVDAVVRDVECDCGEQGKIVIDRDGTHATDNISFEDANWNEEDE